MLEINRRQQLANSLGAHAGIEVIAELFERFKVLLIVEQLAFFQRGHTRIDNYIALEIENPFDIAQGHVQQQADTARQRLEEPDMRNWRCQFDVAHAFTTHLGQGNFNATLLADHSTMLEALVLAAQALVILYRAKDLGAEQAITLGLEGTIIDGFRLFNFTKRP